jgi:acyl carrier protein
MQAHLDVQSAESVQGWLARWLESELGVDPKEIDPHQAFLSYGMDSMHAMMLVGDLEGCLGLRLPPTLAWDYPTMRALAVHVVEQAAGKTAPGGTSPTARSSTPAPASQLDARTLLSQLDGMSEEDMDALLQHYSETPQ